MKLKPMLIGAALVAISGPCTSRAASITINPALDNSIYSENDNSNGQGPLFAGRTNGGRVRRALIQFDIAGAGIPTGSLVDSVSLSLTQLKIGLPGIATLFELRPLLSLWGEGTSSGTGSGGPPTTGDATWNYELYNTSSWGTAGGDFGPASGSTTFGAALTTYTFSSQSGMVTDVQNWLGSPLTNFGWILMAADEAGVTSARELGSRESALAQRPVLTITYTPVPEPHALGLLAVVAVYFLVRRARRLTFC